MRLFLKNQNMSWYVISIVDIVSGMTSDLDPSPFLPLPLASFHILLAVGEESRHGYAIIQAVEARTNGSLRLSPGTLYRSIQRMLEDGLIEEMRDRPAPELDDERRRYYRITPLGNAVVRAETQRLTDLVGFARALGMAPEKI